MAIEDLDGVRGVLYKIFNEAVERHNKYYDPESAMNDGSYGGGQPDNFSIQNRIAIGTLGQAIGAVESAQSRVAPKLPGKTAQ